MAGRPNVVLVMTDQQRADFLAGDGFPLDTMPFLDSLAAEGVRFDHAYTPIPVCVPARTSLLTGRYPQATRVRENWGPDNAYAPADLVGLFRQHGYSTWISGKNHSHLKPDAFDGSRLYMHIASPRVGETTQQAAFTEWLKESNHGVNGTPTPFPLDCQYPYRIVDDATALLAGRDPDRPFFLWLSFPEPHNPYQVPEPYFSLFPEDEIPARHCGTEEGLSKGPAWRWLLRLMEEKWPGYDARWRRYRADYCGMLRLIDDQLRRFCDWLDEAGLRDETLLVFLSDHGDYAGDYGLQRKGVGLPECLVRVPLLFCGPGVRTGREREAFVSLVDVAPTLLEAAGIDIPYGMQGRSLWPLLRGQPYPRGEFRSVYATVGIGGLPWGEDERPPLHYSYIGRSLDELNAVTQSGRLAMVRKGRRKLTLDSLGNCQLFDVEADPAELNDLSRREDLAAERGDLAEELARWLVRVQDDLPTARYHVKAAPHGWYRTEEEPS